MSIQSKKMSMADKMYKENSPGGKGTSSKYKQNTKGDGKVPMKQAMNGKGTTKGGGQGLSQSNAKGSFKAKYSQADPKGSFEVKYNQ